MHEGSCGCEAIKLKLKGEPIAIGLCHCVDCRKLSGAPFTYNFIAKCSDFEITGSPKAVARAGGSGGAVKNFFCSDCGSPLFGGTLSPNGELETVVVRAGIFDDIGFLHRRRPAVEIYTSQRLEWLAPVDGCAQFEGMLPGGLPKEE